MVFNSGFKGLINLKHVEDDYLNKLREKKVHLFGLYNVNISRFTVHRRSKFRKNIVQFFVQPRGSSTNSSVTVLGKGEGELGRPLLSHSILIASIVDKSSTMGIWI